MTQAIDFGRDISRDPNTGQDPLQREVTGLALLAQAMCSRLAVANGTMLGDPDYGYAIVDELDYDVGPQDAGRVAARIDSEFLKDQRIRASVTTVTITPIGNGGQLLSVSSALDSAAGPFSLTFALSTNLLAPVVSLNGSTTFSLLPMFPATGSVGGIGPPGPAGPPGPPGTAGPPGAGGWTLTSLTGPTTVTAVANTVYYVDVSAGAVIVNLPTLAATNGVEVAYVNGDLGAHSLTVNAPGGVLLSAPPPGGAPVASVVFGTTLPPGTAFSYVWVNAGAPSVYSLV